MILNRTICFLMICGVAFCTQTIECEKNQLKILIITPSHLYCLHFNTHN
uniref:Uncharacterized protein n=1 Tax=Rhizophora mucronata TaxID=61149 RepID=A0A2P2QX37_RHIMU